MPVKFNIKTKIKINGKEYTSPEEMPPDVRQIYEQAVTKGLVSTQVNASPKITFNGQSYNSLDEMPENVRRVYENLISTIDKDQNGIPDALQSSGSVSIQPVQPIQSDYPVTSFSSQINPAESANPNRQLLLALIVLGGLILLALLALLLFMANR